ncbi:transporter substrate-binding domain-containing protein [Coprothermobacteraceae bacterium]|nr:transporter substrate-binding domain-containing protein [Coprothermobacteraceae bacterium]
MVLLLAWVLSPPLSIFAQTVFSVHADNPPFVYTESGKLTGFAIDLAKELGRLIDSDVRFLPFSNQSDAVNSVMTGDADAVLLVARTPDEVQTTSLLYTDPYFSPNYVMAVADDSFLTFKDLKDLPVAVVVGTSAERYLLREGFAVLLRVANNKAALEALTSGTASGAFMSSEEAYEFLVKQGELKGIKLLPERVRWVDYCIAVAPQNVLLREKLNRALYELRASGTYDKLVRNWFGERSLSAEFVSTVLRYAILGLVLGSLAVAIAFYFILRQLRQSRMELAAAYEQLAAENQELMASYEEILNAHKDLEELRAKERSLLELMKNLRPDVDDETFYGYLLDIAMTMVPESQAGSVVILDDDGFVRFKAIKGFSNVLSTLDLRPEWLYKPLDVEVVRELNDDNMPEEVRDIFKSARSAEIKVSLCAPLLVNDQWHGTIFVNSFEDTDFSPQSVELFSALAGAASAFLAIRNQERFTGRFLKEIILTLVKAMEYRDPYTAGHSERVAKLAADFAEFLGYNPNNIRDVYWAGILHDMGKVGVRDEVLSKPGRLTPDEYEEVKKHPMFGEEILAHSDALRKYAMWVGTHHERWDGTGYPKGLYGEEIPLEGRIQAIADAFDAMTTDRPYRKAKNIYEAMEEIKANSGTQFDPYLASQFIYFLRLNYA